mmetsp:Transcript_7501/g.9820  ORF Transcript_7501/g.9820 Transcript_7501/m.9820 type:complete len:171 (+) Transcript_7501:399-911(+)
MIIGFMLETSIGSLRMAVFYFIVLIGAGYFACVCTPMYACGFDLPLWGLIGGMISLLIVNHRFVPKQVLIMASIMIFMFLLISLLIMASASEYNSFFRLYGYATPDWYGSLGGLFFGLFVGLWLMPSKRPARIAAHKSEKLIKLVGMGLTFVWLAVFIPVFYFASDRPPY